MSGEAVARLLARTQLFGQLEADELDRLAGESRVRRYEAGQQVFARGEPGGGVYVVAEGSIALTVTSETGAEVVLAVVRPPRSFGELSAIDGQPRVASAVARQRSTLVAVPKATVARVLREHPSVASALLIEMAAMIRATDDRATDLVLKDLRGRVVRFLLDAAGPRPPAAEAGVAVPVDVRLTQSELASLVGGSRQQVNRIVVALEAEGCVLRKGSRIVAIRPDLLRRGE
ncbi:MAG TPA: Crp/Fnr family transcriptional regulator [Actinomycetes bacterium]|nr:Crp/Fnr family transcriptional regulator [Actinomycetes bacterium]